MDTPTRLNKYLAQTLGISRREADLYIEQGKVVVNGHVASLGKVIIPGRDSVSVNNNTIDVVHRRYSYVLMNKPVGYVCSRKQQGDSPTIYNLLPRQYQHLKVAGRLDKDSQGLLLLTDDGDLIYKLTHPKFGKEKTYQVGLNKPLKPSEISKLSSGIELEDGTSQLKVSAVPAFSKKPNMYTVSMHEGRNRQIRRTFKALGYHVTFLERTSFGPYKLTQLTDKTYLQI